MRPLRSRTHDQAQSGTYGTLPSPILEHGLDWITGLDRLGEGFYVYSVDELGDLRVGGEHLLHHPDREHRRVPLPISA